ncbi:MAG: AMP-binding protein [Actinobacteria bacterium]|nr:AMP-binding protein [Actinomycetota bacterium]
MGEHHLARLAEASRERHPGEGTLLYEGQRFDAPTLWDRILRAAGGFKALGIAPGERVVVLMANCPEVGIAYNALWRIGAVITPVIFLLPPEGIRHALLDAEASAVVTTPEFVTNVRAAAEGVPTLRHVIVAGDTDDEGAIAYADLEQHDPVPITDRADDDLAALMYTGGTTGRSKGVMLTHENLWYCGRSGHLASYIPDLNRVIVPLPLAHAFGLIVTVIGLHSTEPRDTVLMRWFDAAGFLQLVEQERCERATLVPAMLQLLLQQPLEDHDLSSWATINVGSAPLPLEVATEFERRVPSLTIYEGYGLTESGGIVTTNRPGARKLGTVGTPIDGYEVRVVDDDGNDVDAGQPGEVIFRSRGTMSGYWRSPEATEQTIVDGWVHSGDIGVLDEDGYLSIVDRKKDLIIRAGFNVYPRDVEDALVEHPAVAMAGVVGAPDEAKGEEVVAFVSLAPGAQADADELVAWAREHIGGYRYPREVRVIDAIPLTPIGKTDRRALRARLSS